MAITLPELPYAYDALEPYFDKQTMELHHDKHHATYVANLNKALEKHPELGEDVYQLMTHIETVPTDIRQAVINNGGGHLNHTLFWQLLTTKETHPSEALRSDIKETFGSFEDFKSTFTQVAASRFGSGWAWLVVNENGALEVLSTPNQDHPILQGKTPILGLDVWEHAYYLRYQNLRLKYIEAFFQLINWETVNRLYQEAK